jgi:hypothetical protein
MLRTYRALSFLTGTVCSHWWSGIGCPIAAVVSFNALHRTERQIARPEVARMTIVDEQSRQVNSASPAELRGRINHRQAIGP